MSDITLEIDGQTCTAQSGMMIIEVADREGISIPRFCYHPELSIAANCRMCLVEVGKSKKPLPACATPVTEGMQVFTTSALAREAQQAVMEFLLINHPLDCPICDQGGECELQDVSMGYGAGVSYFSEGKRAVEDENLGSLIATEMTRCIHCTRCVRFGEEVAGLKELGGIGRGEHTSIQTFVNESLTSEVSGNIIDLCPVGALTARPSRFKARAWELTEHRSIAQHDCLGSHLRVHTRRGEVMRVLPGACESINHVWLSDRDRFSYTGLRHADRLESPLVKSASGQWQAVSWADALLALKKQYQKYVALPHGRGVQSYLSPNLSVETLFLWQRLSKASAWGHDEYRVQSQDARVSSFLPGMDISLNALERSKQVVLIGSDLMREQPLLGLRVRKAQLLGASVYAMNPWQVTLPCALADVWTIHPNEWMSALLSCMRAVSDLKPKAHWGMFQEAVQAAKVNEQAKAWANALVQHDAVLLVGALIQQHPEAAVLLEMLHVLRQACGIKSGLLTQGANAGSAARLGLMDEQPLDQPGLTWLLDVDESDLSFAHLKRVEASSLVVAFGSYHTPWLQAHANFIFPCTLFTEHSGHVMNVLGELQLFDAVVKPFAESRPWWKVLCALAQILDVGGFDYADREQVFHDAKAALQEKAGPVAWTYQGASPSQAKASYYRVGSLPLYRSDALVRHAIPLQRSGSADACVVRMHSNDAKKLGVREGDRVSLQQEGSVVLPVVLDDRLPAHGVYVPSGFAETAALGPLFSGIHVLKEA